MRIKKAIIKQIPLLGALQMFALLLIRKFIVPMLEIVDLSYHAKER